jgi:hypothetical protein
MRAATTDRRVISTGNSTARVIGDAAVMKSKEERSRQVEEEAYEAAAQAEAKEQRAAVWVRLLRQGCLRCRHQGQGKGKAVAVADASVMPPSCLPRSHDGGEKFW